jgi:CBS domain-containing protein
MPNCEARNGVSSEGLVLSVWHGGCENVYSTSLVSPPQLCSSQRRQSPKKPKERQEVFMQVAEIMTRDAEVIPSELSVRDAAKKMQELDVGFLPVRDGDRLVGMLTDRDITVRLVAEGRDPAKTLVKEIMTPEVLYCFDDQDISEAALLMQEKQIRRLPVLNRQKRLVGIISLGDLAVHTGEEKLAGETVREVSEPAEPNR